MHEGGSQTIVAMGLTQKHSTIAAAQRQPCLHNSSCIQGWMVDICHVTTSTGGGGGGGRRRSRKNMMMNFAVPFVLINLICAVAAAALGSGSEGSFPNEPTASPSVLVDPNLPINGGAFNPLPQQQERQPKNKRSSGTGREKGVAVSTNGSETATVTKVDMDYVQEDDAHEIVADDEPTDVQDHFYLNQKYKEKDIPVPFTYGDFKRYQQPPPPPSNFYTAHQQGRFPNFPTQQQPSSPVQNRQKQPGRQATATGDPMFTREITIKQGRVKGIVRTMYRDSGIRDVDQFLGLPYAESPVGNKRFMPPGAPPPWPKVRLANKLPPVCPQKLPKLDATSPNGTPSIGKGRYNQLKRLLPYLKEENEDCLYLNLYVPRLDGKPIPRKFPVMVFIHGESYEWNSGNAYDGSVLASYGGVIVVTLNYRLGILGFLKPSVSDQAVGNFGLLDQVAALHWIKGNIEAFGGDNSSVTLMGHGTGAALVNLLMVSPVARGLFHRAILMSGSALSDWAITTHALQSTLQVTQGLNCPLSDNQEEMLTCLRRKRYSDIVNVKTSSPEFSTSFGPVIDGLVIPNEPHTVMGQYSDLFSRYDLMFGVTELESYHALDAVALQHGLLESEKNQMLRFYTQNRFEIRPDIALVATLKEYTDSYTDPKRAKAEEHRETLLEILSDARLVSPLIQAGIYHAKVNPRTYMYVFGHNSEGGDYSHLPLSVIGEELAYVFGAPLAEVGPFPRSFSAKERLLSEATMKYWTNFAKTGNPKAPWKDMFINLGRADWQKYDVDWSEFEPVNRTFLNLGLPPVVQQKYREKYMDFWNNRLPDELRNVKNLKPSPPYADYYGPSNQPIEMAQPFRPPPLPTRPTSSSNPFIDGQINLYPKTGPPGSRPTYDPYQILQTMEAPHPRRPDVMAHPGTMDGGGRGRGFGGTTERIIIVEPDPDDVPIQKADVTVYVLIFMVVLLVLLLAVFGVALRRAYQNKREANQVNGTTHTTSTDKISTDMDESYVIAPRKKQANKYESMKFCRNFLQKVGRRNKSQVFSKTSKVSEWMTTDEMLKYSPKYESKLTLNRHSSFLAGPEKVSVAIDATPQNRSDSVLRQEPIEITKAKANYLHNNDRIIICQEIDDLPDIDIPNRSSYGSHDSSGSSNDSGGSCCSSGSNMSNGSGGGGDGTRREVDNQFERRMPPQQMHKGALLNPQPCFDQYEEMMESSLGDDEQVTSFIDNEDINVTSRDDSVPRDPLSPMETLSNIQRMKFPKVLPDYPETKNQNRHSLPSSAIGGVSIDVHHVPPQPGSSSAASNTATLGRYNRHRRPPSRIIGASETRVAPEPPQPEEPPITSNTLIVGPLVRRATATNTSKGVTNQENPLQSPKLSNRIPILKSPSGRSIVSPLGYDYHHQQQPALGMVPIGERKMMPLPGQSTESLNSISNSSNDSVETVKQVHF